MENSIFCFMCRVTWVKAFVRRLSRCRRPGTRTGKILNDGAVRVVDEKQYTAAVRSPRLRLKIDTLIVCSVIVLTIISVISQFM